jgi:hypothetical protein
VRKKRNAIDGPAVTARAAFESAIAFAGKRISPGFLLLLAMTTTTWRQALFAGKTLVHGDSIVFGLPLFGLRTNFLYGHASALWANNIFGGHPLYAEGQAAFLSPLPLLFAAIVTPVAGAIYSENLFAFACMILTGIGVLGLARSLGISRWASAFAALAVVFSPIWENFQSNPGVGGPFLWVPWCLWAFEIWLKRPSFRSAMVLALAAAMLFIAGYPEASHGTLVYMALSLVTIPFYAKTRKIWAASWRVRLVTGVVAAVFCLGMAAIQWMPMLELVGLSHRNMGAALQFQVGPDYFFRGMLYSFHTIASNSVNRFLPGAGSLLVCMLASWAIVFNTSPRVAGHFIAALVLLQLGIGIYWPPFRFIYEHGLLPGLHYFRVVYLYVAIGVVGVAILAATAIDGIKKLFADMAAGNGHEIRRRWIIGGSVVLAVFWTWGLLSLPTPDASIIEFLMVAAAALGVAALVWFKSAARIPLLLTLLLVVECCFLRLAPFRLGSPELLQKPASVAAIQALPDWRDYKVMDASLAPVYCFLDSRSPGVVPGVRRMLASMSGSTPILWGIHGMDGALALPLERRTEINPLLLDEINGKTAASPGSRLLDILGIRFITVDGPVHAPAFRVFWHEDYGNWLMENTAALPRFQIYKRHITVDSPDAALDVIKDWKKPTLVIENPPGEGHQTEMADAAGDVDNGGAQSATFKVLRAKTTRYDLILSAKRQVWLFLADANYPGWKAFLDGKEIPLFSAQVLGKAVGIPKGRHTLSIEFHSASFVRGAWIGAISFILALIFWIFGPRLTLLTGASPEERA